MGMVLLKIDDISAVRSLGKYALSSIVQLISGNIVIVSPERDKTGSRASTWNSQQGGRHRIQGNEGLMQLHDHSICIPINLAINGFSPNRFICITANQTATPLLQLEARPRSFPSHKNEGLCQSPMVPDFSLPKSDKETKIQSSSGDTTVHGHNNHGFLCFSKCWPANFQTSQN